MLTLLFSGQLKLCSVKQEIKLFEAHDVLLINSNKKRILKSERTMRKSPTQNLNLNDLFRESANNQRTATTEPSKNRNAQLDLNNGRK
jgi:hypothetical protein